MTELNKMQRLGLGLQMMSNRQDVRQGAFQQMNAFNQAKKQAEKEAEAEKARQLKFRYDTGIEALKMLPPDHPERQKLQFNVAKLRDQLSGIPPQQEGPFQTEGGVDPTESQIFASSITPKPEKPAARKWAFNTQTRRNEPVTDEQLAANPEIYDQARSQPSAPSGMQFDESGQLGPIPGFMQTKAQIADATRQPESTELTKLQNIRGTIEDRLAKESDPAKREKLERNLSEVQKQIDKKGAIVGRTSFDNDAQPLTNSTRTEVQKSIVEADKQLVTLKRITETVEKRFLETFPRFQHILNKGAEKLGIASEATKEDIAEFTKFKSNGIRLINDYIQMITGAAMGIEEAKRIRKGIPDPGEGVFDGDSFTEYKSKLQEVTREIEIKRNKAMWQLKRGLEPIGADGKETMTNSQFMNEIEARGEEIEKQLLESGSVQNADEAYEVAKIMLQRELAN